MKRTTLAILRQPRMIVFLIVLILAVAAISWNPANAGAAIRGVVENSSASLAGIERPSAQAPPMTREVITAINNQPVDSVEEYYAIITAAAPNQTLLIKTTKGIYRVITRAEGNAYPPEDIGLQVYEAPTTNIRQGLDLSGGTRVLLEPEEEVTSEQIERIISNLDQRLNVYGLSDMSIKSAGDLSGNQYILVEIAGANEEEVKDLLASQEKFEAKVGNTTVFTGGEDIPNICRSPECSGLDPSAPCGEGEGGWFCRFQFSITLSQNAAKKQAEATRGLEVVTENDLPYLSEKLGLYLDDKLVDELSIAADLQGREVQEIAISGSNDAPGISEQDAILNSLAEMKKLQTILDTGSLPVKLFIKKTDTISPALGEQFLHNAVFVGLLAILSVVIVVFIAYRRLVIVIPMLLTMLSETIILLGVAALIGWNLDLAAIAGIIVSIGTGVDDQIVITDEMLNGESRGARSIKEKFKRAFFIIMAAYTTTLVAMAPLLFAGAGLLKGFALTTIIGVSVGVLITRPAYAAVLRVLLNE